MMNVNDKRTRTETKEFIKLGIGDAYEDKEGFLCIKTDEHNDCYHNNCIALVDGCWEAHFEAEYALVYPVATTLVLERGV